ncbi:MAG: HAD-IA family hydrolase [Candidatus Levybacteria bacterium]|nr:HAD-IA family hydrolase [Candidatus Levybacteria bacterium]
MVIKAIIFDFAGVIGVDGYWVWLRENVPNIEEKRPFFQKISEEVDKGIITNKEFVEQIARETKKDVNIIWPQIFQKIAINTALLEYITQLKTVYKIGLPTNYTYEWFDEIFQKHNLTPYFDQILISSRYKLIKPEPEAFLKILELLQVTKEEAVFIDDRQGHVDASNKIGLKAFLFVDNEKLKQDLESYGIKS